MDLIALFKFGFFLGGLTSFFLGIFIYWQNRNDNTSRMYFWLSLGCAIWSFGFLGLIVSTNLSEATYWRWVMESGSITIPIFWLLFVYNFLSVPKNRMVIGVSIFLTCVLWIINLLDLFNYHYFATELVSKNIFQFYPSASIGYYAFFLYFFSIVIFTLYLLSKNLNNKDINKTSQIKFLIVASSIGFIGGGSTFLLTLNIHFTPYGVILFSFYPLIVAYTIAKFKLFNIKVVAAQMIVTALVIFLLVRTLVSETAREQLLNSMALFLFSFFGVFLILSVKKEVKQREEIERLAGDLRIANERLKELDKLKSEFVSIASHQLRSPLTAIKGYASLIKDGSFGKVPPGIADAIDRIFNSSQALVLMVEDFLNISRIEQGRMKYEFEALEMSSLIEEIIAELKPSVEKANLALSFSTDKQEPYCIKADKGKIRQVVSNLIDNAVKYTPKGSISVTLSKKPAHGKILLAVSDTGIGIDAETLPNLFAKFSRAKDANKVNVIGTGLGLYIVKEIVNGHKGRVWAESAGKNKGSSFFVELAEDSEAIHATRVADFAKTM